MPRKPVKTLTSASRMSFRLLARARLGQFFLYKVNLRKNISVDKMHKLTKKMADISLTNDSALAIKLGKSLCFYTYF